MSADVVADDNKSVVVQVMAWHLNMLTAIIT